MAVTAAPPPVPAATAYVGSFDDRVAALLATAPGRVPAVADRLRAAGPDAGDAPSPAALLDRVPVMTKDDLISLQAARPPFGGLVAEQARLRRVFQSPGPLYEPELAGPDPWGWAPALSAAGFTAGEVVLNCFGYHLTPAGRMFEAGAHALGCVVVPAGVGGSDLQVRACVDTGATGFLGLPSYLKALLERAEAEGVRLPLRRAFLTAEPLPPSLREWLQDRVPVVRAGYGTAEAGNLGYECDEVTGLHVPEDRYVQVCDLHEGRSLWSGEEGQVVVSLLSPDRPLVRLGTGDLSAFLPGECPCGRWTPRLAGWLGRVGEAVKVRGMFLHPRQARAVMADLPDVAGYRFVVERAGHKDLLRCEVVARAPDLDLDLVRARLRRGLRFDATVERVDSVDPTGPVIVDSRTWE
ncbi:MAG TPA: AMP-binding protein [Dermatophilaceae bacterium]|nr:AMP-binding protein [Dermatophilaceae bacterium]